MAVLVVPNALQAVVQGQIAGETWVNVLGITAPNGFLLAQSNANELAEAVLEIYEAQVPSLSTAWTLSSVAIRDLRTATAPSWDATIFPLAGAASEQIMPPQSSIVASHKTGRRGPAYRGRTYLAGFTEATNTGDGKVAAVTSNQILTGFINATTALAAVTGGPFELAVISRKNLEANPIVSTTVDEEWDRQNRRKRRG